MTGDKKTLYYALPIMVLGKQGYQWNLRKSERLMVIETLYILMHLPKTFLPEIFNEELETEQE